MNNAASGNSPENTPQPYVPRARIPRRLFSTLEGVFREERFFLILSVFIGLFSGLAVVCFRLAIDWSRIWLLGPAPAPHSLRVLFTPPLVSLLIAVIVIHLFPLARGSAVNQTKAALY